MLPSPTFLPHEYGVLGFMPLTLAEPRGFYLLGHQAGQRQNHVAEPRIGALGSVSSTLQSPPGAGGYPSPSAIS